RAAFGPGLLWAGAAIGVSHLVQSTRAGASFGLGLLGIVLFANLYKYPAFSFGPRYAAATGTSLLEGYRREGRWALVLYAVLTLGSMFTVQAAVTFVTAALFTTLTGWSGSVVGIPSFVAISAGLLALCAGLLLVGHYRWLDKIIKVVVVVLTATTLLCTLAVVGKVPFDSLRFVPAADWVTTATTAVMLCGLIGWMPAAVEISVWHSLWTLARRRETGVAPSVGAAMFDFNVGYLGTAVLAVCFVFMGAGTMYASGAGFEASPVAFAAQVIRLYTENLGAWTGPVVTLSAFTVMFSTTLTVVDGFPRALATLAARFVSAETPGEPDRSSRRLYWAAMVVLFFGSLAVIRFFLGSLTLMADVAATMSLLIAPALAWLNHRAMTSAAVPAAHRPGAAMRAYSVSGIAVSLSLAVYFVIMRWGLGVAA
ncbi:MAG: NRAMP family divalent metal transporter, partial [Gammaproteobacteria bacterium]